MKCFMSELGKDEGACDQQAKYIALLSWSNQRWYLCEEHAQEERASDDVIEIRSLPREQVPA